jgi:hypothetical protein
MKLILLNVAMIGLLASGGGAIQLANADQCISQCRAAHNQCRIAAKAVSSPQCDAQLQACIERCGTSR